MTYEEILEALAKVDWEVYLYRNNFRSNRQVEFVVSSAGPMSPNPTLDLWTSLSESHGRGKTPFYNADPNFDVMLFKAVMTRWKLNNEPLDTVLALPFTPEFQMALGKVKAQLLRYQRRPSTQEYMQQIRAYVK